MKDLALATGVAKSTILLYVKKGLLPKPVKTSPNMAYYDPACIDRIAFIKKIQSSRRLPLAAIKGLLKEMDRGRDIAPLLELQSMLFGSAEEKMDAAVFCTESGLTPGQLSLLCEKNLIVPLEKDMFDEGDLALARQLKGCLDLGIGVEDLGFYPKFARQIVAEEISLREKYTKDLGFKENAGLTLELTLLARGMRAYIIDRTLQKELIRFKGLNQT